MALEAETASQVNSTANRVEWDAILSANHALCAIQDALFVMEEQRQEHDAIWDRATIEPHAHRNVRSDLSVLDEATGRLVAAQGLGANCIGQIAQTVHSNEAAEVCATLLKQWERTRTRVAAVLGELFLDRSFLIVYDVCVQAHDLMDSLETALEQATALSPSRTDGYHQIFEARRAHYVPACRRVIDVLNQQKETCALLRPKTKPTLDAVSARWCALEARIDSQTQQALTNSMHSLQLDDTQASREKRRARDSDPGMRVSITTPSKLPRTIKRLPSMSLATPPSLPNHHSMAKRAPLSDSPSERRISESYSMQQEKRSTRKLKRHVSQSFLPIPPTYPDGSLKNLPLPSTPILPNLQLNFAPGSEPIPARYSVNLKYRESMLPRLTPQKPSTESPRFHTQSKRHASYQHIRSTRSMQGLQQRFASGEITSPNTKSSMAYVPDQNDALDIGVARICNAREILVHRIDHGGIHDEYHRYAFRSKTMICRLLYTQRPKEPYLVDPKHIHVRVGGGWLELSSWVDAYIAN
ncbi:hypothetical protein MPSI1_002068 [Malassezia psittaci]|uniref:GAR domain-containing protein n=1 Tax=Malassezia psittaci TaxID=1821823 RepID=A0AAF0JDV9_9BASI|nr:hypothetical protein MPSI1_002068 [Malassezia psittaci]